MNTSNLTTPTVIYEDDTEMTHQAPWYFCGSPDCLCHDDEELAAPLIALLERHEITAAQALAAFWPLEQERQA